jgi:hypothetical protein
MLRGAGACKKTPDLINHGNIPNMKINGIFRFGSF